MLQQAGVCWGFKARPSRVVKRCRARVCLYHVWSQTKHAGVLLHQLPDMQYILQRVLAKREGRGTCCQGNLRSPLLSCWLCIKRVILALALLVQDACILVPYM